MDLEKAIAQFFDESGNIRLAPQLTLAGLSELMYQGDLQMGGGERHCIRFWDFSESREGVAVDYNRTEINTRIKAVAARLQQVAKMGDRIAILAGNSPEYLFGFIGALYAGMVPVPLYDPNEPGHGDHLRAVIGDSEPTVVLTNKASAGAVREHFADIPSRERPRILSVDSLPDTLAESYQNPASTLQGQQMAMMATQLPIDTTAFLQYTSGSTRTPAGVVLTNRSILTNVLQIFAGAKLQMPLRLVTWLPLHHDMGIILAVFVIMLGLPMEIMSPRDFIQQPSRWTRQLASRGENDVNTYAVVPNFALELAVRYGKPEEGQDFSNVDGIIIGSEPVSESAVENFAEVFVPAGLKREALRPSYGLAEASLLVTTPQTENRPVISHFDRDELAGGKAVLVERGSDNAVAFASNGQVVRPQALTIVDPETKAELADGLVGEIWTNGQNTAAGYLDRPEDTAETFGQKLGERLGEGSRAEGFPDEGWLATGDLGTIIDGETYITGRLKDLVVIAGRNHYPQDIEATVQEASAHVRADSIAAFAIPGEASEQLVILVERADDADSSGDEAAVEDIRAAVASTHGVTPAEIRFHAPNEIARSSSGKIARRVNQKAYLAER
ncbi:FadD32-like long-chain-fatty-acid--AMP ligase [Corynebacterium guangdongense]|uniref:Fatty acid CoA ligase FadD32 n=1 Tax=Corynebacterium guangdongense TaxID=1783348 RepID=A0ABU1ZZT1_9CORY|nr:FadD32-like long-chain-fatty-acid--AMP ligase [Corynebacterium guangdongense]MDR7330452.1 fatty acid CoA ligase FadD32 [Corynebacterium guangdongense]WJZ19010.1 Long-chain-fatty-acid--AMP ligase FadD32 [Corynebacterium guangdongense]